MGRLLEHGQHGLDVLRRAVASPDGSEVNVLPLTAVQLSPGDQGSASWSYAMDQAGDWDAAYGIWKDAAQTTALVHTFPALEGDLRPGRYTYGGNPRDTGREGHPSVKPEASCHPPGKPAPPPR